MFKPTQANLRTKPYTDAYTNVHTCTCKHAHTHTHTHFSSVLQYREYSLDANTQSNTRNLIQREVNKFHTSHALFTFPLGLNIPTSPSYRPPPDTDPTPSPPSPLMTTNQIETIAIVHCSRLKYFVAFAV